MKLGSSWIHFLRDVLRPDLWLVGYGLDVLASVGSVQIGCGQLCHAVPEEWLCITVSHAPDAMASFASFPSWNWYSPAADRIVAPNVDGPNSLPFPRRATMLPCYGVKVQTKRAPSGVRNMSFIKLSPSASLQQCRLSLLVFWLCQGRRWTGSLFNYISS